MKMKNVSEGVNTKKKKESCVEVEKETYVKDKNKKIFKIYIRNHSGRVS